jgi:hypothetical protein
MGQQQDTNPDSASISTQQQVQFSTEAQDTSPPTYQPELITAPLENGLAAAPYQLKGNGQRSKPLDYILIGVAIVLIAVGATGCILNITGIIKGPWSSIFGVVMASIGVVIPLIRHLLKLAAVPTASVPIASLPPNTQPLDSLNGGISIPRPSGQEGVLLVHTKKALRGLSVDLCCGFGDGMNTVAAQNIVERKIKGNTYYTAIFRSIPSGSYTAHIYKRELMAKITVDPGEVAEIDWR